MLAGGEEDEKARVIICMTINKTRTNPAWKAILAGYSCLHKYIFCNSSNSEAYDTIDFIKSQSHMEFEAVVLSIYSDFIL